MAEREVGRLAEAALRRYPGEAARLLDACRTPELTAFLERRDPEVAAEVLRRLPADQATDAIEALSGPAATTILTALEPGLAAGLLARLDPKARAARLGTLGAGLAKELEELMTYPPGVAGEVMDPRVTRFAPDTLARQALAHVRRVKNRSISEVYVTDEEGRLTGSVGVQELALAALEDQVGVLARPLPPRVQALDPLEEVILLAEEARLTSVPVVDVSDRLLGVIRYTDLLSATHRDATADLQTMVGVSKEERALSRPSFAVRKRLPWLQINLVTAFLAASVVGLFEDTIAQFTALAVLLPVVAGQSGNTGAQALAVTMRGLVLREIRVRHWFRVASKELIVGAVNGVAVAFVTALGVLAWSRSFGLAAVIGAAMVCSMVVAGVAGASVPMVLILLRQDPAAASSIVLTTVTDVMGFFTFLGFATLASGIL
jgi:magnesium transporter